jgi:hypothetical protein
MDFLWIRLALLRGPASDCHAGGAAVPAGRRWPGTGERVRGRTANLYRPGMADETLAWRNPRVPAAKFLGLTWVPEIIGSLRR